MQQIGPWKVLSQAMLLAFLAFAPNISNASEQIGSKDSHGARQHGQNTLNVNGVPYSIDVEIAAGAAGDDTLAKGAYVFRFKCSADLFCSLERITLNECESGVSNEPAFSARTDSWVTSSGLLAVKQLSNSEIEMTVYQAFGNQLPAKVTIGFASEGVPFKKLTSFKTAGFIDLRLWPNTKTGIEYVPLQRDRRKILNCPVLLRGLNP